MAKKIYRIVSWGLLAFTLVSIFLILRKPSLPPIEVSAEAAKSFDQKLSQANEAHQQGTPQEIRITEVELNSKLQEAIQGAAPSGGPASVTTASVHLEGGRLQGTFTANIGGKEVYVTLGGNLAVSNGSLEFKPTDVQMGSLPVPLGLVESTLRERLNSPEMRERMKLPDSIRDVRIENGELVLQSQ